MVYRALGMHSPQSSGEEVASKRDRGCAGEQRDLFPTRYLFSVKLP
jgi:hypothetical protein